MIKKIRMLNDGEFWEREDMALYDKKGKTIEFIRRNKRYFIEINDLAKMEFEPYKIVFEKAHLVRDVKQLYQDQFDIHDLFKRASCELIELIREKGW